ncbi:MAG: hypothetical protein WKF37_22550 [Bryobacteraceae bacterium]
MLSVLFLPLLLLSSSLALQAQNQLDANLTLFSVMTAYTVANEPLSNPTPFQTAVRSQVVARKPAVLSELKNFFSSHKKAGTGADLAQYVSFALTTSEPPEFRQRFQGADVPPDVQALEGFQELMARFYSDAGIADLWQKSQPDIDKVLERYQAPVAQSVLEVNAYLRNPTSGYMGRRFFVILDPLGPATQVHARSYQDDYYVVVPAAAQPRVDDVRHAYLHYLVDPLLIKFSEKVNKNRGLIDYAQAAPLLGEEYKADFVLLATESLIRAIEGRLKHSSANATEALSEGFVLAPFFAEQLPHYEKQEAAMRLHFPEMMAAMDLRKEAKRLADVSFATAKVMPAMPKAVAEPVAETASSVRKLYAKRELESQEAFLTILREGGEREIHSRAYFGLARVAALEKDPSWLNNSFVRHWKRADAYTMAWSEVTWKLAEAAEEAEARQHHQAALAVKEFGRCQTRAEEGCNVRVRSET